MSMVDEAAIPDWKPDGDYTDIGYETAEGIAKVTICRPEVRNAFRPKTLYELSDAFELARDDPAIGVIILTGEGPDAFCSGGDQRIRGDDGYVGDDGVGRLNVLDLQVQIRRLPKPVVAMVAGYAIGGGHVLHVVCDLTICADNARFGQTGPKVGSFDGGLVSQDAGQEPAGPAPPQGGLQRRHRRPGWHPAAGRRRHPALLHERGGQRGARRLRREAAARLREVPPAALRADV